MATKTLTVNGQPFYINRDRKAGVTELKNNETKVQGNPFVRLGTLGSFSATSNSFSSGTNTSGSNARVGVVLNRALSVSETAKATVTITGTVDSITASNGIEIGVTEGATGFGAWTPNQAIPVLNSTGSFTITFSALDTPQKYLQGINFLIENNEAIAISNLSVIVDSPEISTVVADRTAPVIDSDPVGKSRPLLGKLVGDAAAAYSLRDLNTKQGDTDVVNVRRSADNLEKIFKAKDVPTIEDWTNGKLETTLPADVATAAAAYSLRKVKASYSGDAVRIRRSSDDIEVDVAFDSDDKVSASSSITNIAEQGGESGSTTATDLNGFLNETLTVGTAVNGTGGFDNYTLTNVSNTGFSADNSAGGTGSAGFPYKHATGDVMVIRYTVSNFSSTSSLSPVIRGTTGVGSVVGTTTGGTEILANGTRTETLTATAEGTHLMFADGNTGSYTISDFEIVSHTHLAFVHTWYDQAGSNNAVQDTATNQPKIAENGALVADGIEFDGSSSFLDATSALGATSTIGIFSVIKPDSTDNDGFILDNRDANDDGARLMQSDSGIGKYLFSMDTTDVSLADEGVSTTETLITAIQSSTAATLFRNAVQVATAADNPISVTSAYRIGSNRVTAGITFFDGTMKEIILFTSDQSDNRFKIESNINNYYGLYNDELNFTSVVSPGTLPTAITTSDGTVEIGSTSQPITTNSKNSIKYNYNSGSYGTGNIFTRYMLDSGSDFIGLAQGDTIQVSLFVEELTSGVTLKLILNDNYTALSDESDISSVGFHSLTLTRNSTSGTEDNLQFKSLGLAGAVNISIKDIKVSRISRNGFVETWYDQSGNDRHMTQADENHQPRIVRNGGQVIDPSSRRPSINFGLQPDGTGGRLLKLTSNIPQTTDNSFTQLVVASIDRTDIANARITGGAIDLFINADEKLGTRFGNNKTSTTLSALGVNSTTLLGAVVTTSKVPTLHFNNTEQTLSAHSGTGTPTMFQILGENNTTGDSLNRYHLSGTMSEAICYLSDQTNNIPALKANINNQYQLYS
jgi:hypothetical protein